MFALFGLPGFVNSDRGSAFMSRELKNWLHSKGVVTSRTTPYNPQGNGQVERYNGIVWKTVSLALKTHRLPTSKWELELLDALHSIRTLISTATNETPHERFFSYHRKSSTGCSLPSWLTSPGKVLLKRHVRQSKYEPLVEEVDLLEANPNYAHIRKADGKETTVSLRDLAPRGKEDGLEIQGTTEPFVMRSPDNIDGNCTASEELCNMESNITINTDSQPMAEDNELNNVVSNDQVVSTELPLRRSQRNCNKPDRLDL